MRNDSNRQFVHILAASLVVAVMLSGVAAWAQSGGEKGGTERVKEELVELKLKLPQPFFVPTPRPYPKTPHVQPEPEYRRKPLKVPADVKLVSAGKPVISSATDGLIIGKLSQITDGKTAAVDPWIVVVDFDKQWVQIDLESEYEVHAILIWHSWSFPRIYHDVIVQASNEATFQNNVITLFNNDHDNSYGLGKGKDLEYVEEHCGKLIDVNQLKTRYLRFHSNGSTADDLNHYIEIEVFGRRPKQDTNTGTDNNETRASK